MSYVTRNDQNLCDYKKTTSWQLLPLVFNICVKKIWIMGSLFYLSYLFIIAIICLKKQTNKNC